MNISEIVKKLEAYKEIYGDINIGILTKGSVAFFREPKPKLLTYTPTKCSFETMVGEPIVGDYFLWL
jgi:hypothetical protein